MRLATILIFSVLLWTASGPSDALRGSSGVQDSGRSESAEEAAVRAVLQRQEEDWNRGDVNAFMRGYWNSPQTEFVSANGIVRGWNTVMERYRKSYPDATAMGHLTFSELEISLLGRDAALVVGRWHLKRQSGAAGGLFTLVFRRLPEGWRIINDHTSQTPTP